MKCVIIFVSCVLAAASAGYAGHGATSYAYQSHPGAVAYNAPVVHGGYAHGHGYAAPVAHGYAHAAPIAHGAPVPVQDTYEVAAAKAAHFQAHAAARGQAHGYAHAAPVAHGYAHAAPIAHGAPVPVQDTYEVAAAKAAHFQAHAAARGQAHGYAHAAPIAHGYSHGYGSEARLVDPVAIAAGAPLPGGDTYEVAAAKAAHLQAHAAAKSGHQGSYYG